MKHVLTLAILLIGINVFGQPNLKGVDYILIREGESWFTLAKHKRDSIWYPSPVISHDTIYLDTKQGINFIKVGDKVYKLTVPSPLLEEVKPLINIFPLQFGSGTYIPTIESTIWTKPNIQYGKENN